jgi:glycogen operon protein
VKDITWYNADGAEMTDEAWAADFAKIMGVMLCGDSLDVRDADGKPLRDDTFLLYTNSHHEDREIQLPSEPGVVWDLVLDTSREHGFVEPREQIGGGTKHTLPARSLVLLVQKTGSDEEARHAFVRRSAEERAR